jgi:polar amino acid transport system substrate-binding protein
MKQLYVIRILKKAVSILILFLLMFTYVVEATGPRVSPSLFTSDVSEIYAVDFPPFITTEISSGGFHAEIIDAVVQAEGIKAMVTAVPLARMAKYYLHQETALAVLGNAISFSEEEKNSLIAIPISITSEKNLYYAPKQNNAAIKEGKLSELDGIVYGAQHSEDVSQYKKAGAKVVYARIYTLFKKLVAGDVDLIRAPLLTIDWMVERYHLDKKSGFVMLKKGTQEQIHYLLFNTKYKKGREIATRFRHGLVMLIENGKYQKIIQRYISDTSEQKLRIEQLKVLLQ